MAKYMGDNVVFSIGGNAITCIQSVDTNETIDTAVVACSAGTHKEVVTGQRESSITVNLALESNDVTVLNYFTPGTTGAIILQANGATAGDWKLTSTNGSVSQRGTSTPVSGFGTASFTVLLDDATIAANT